MLVRVPANLPGGFRAVTVPGMSVLTVRGVDLHHDLAGLGPTMIWGHGLTSSQSREDATGLVDWARVREHARVLRYDARGHGDSESTADPGDYHWRALAHDQLALADALDIERYIAGGASMGCATALHAAVLAPERVSALVLVIPPTAWATRAAQQQGYEVSARLVEQGQLDLLVQGARATPSPDPLVDEPAWKDGFEQMIRSTDPVRLARIFRGAAITDLPEPDAIAAIDVPTLILCWTGDAGHPFSTAERLAELIQGSHIAVASTSGQLAGWTSRIVRFLDDLV
jgi:3-oxoadipate enol-lactonase